MNDPGLQDAIQESEAAVKQRLDANKKTMDSENKPPTTASENSFKEYRRPGVGQEHKQDQHSRHPKKKGGRSGRNSAEEESSIYQSTFWWFTSTAFPLFAGTFGPVANLLSVCALVESWRVQIDDESKLPDPHWLTGLNATSLFLALIANLVLMFNFARRIRYTIAQPITITLWYLSSILLVVCLCLVNTMDTPPDLNMKQLAHSQSYYYGLITSILYFSIATLLLISSLGSVVFHAYPPSFSTLTGPQRTLMLQTTSFSLYLALGAGVFAAIEGWAFTDGIYWADYTLLTVGLGSDFPLGTVLGRMLLIPYAAIGIMLIGLVISSVRGLVLERAKAKVVRRHLQTEREKWAKNINERRRAASRMATRTTTQDSGTPSASLPTYATYWRKWKEQQLMRLPRQLHKHADIPLKHADQKGAWHRAEFELMRLIQGHSEQREAYEALCISFPIILIVWIGGTLIFWSCEHNIQGWSFPDSFYFSYTSLLTIGYGDFYPSSSAGKPFFVIWSLIAVPAMTVFISNLGDTAIKWLEEITVWISSWTILPEKSSDPVEKNHPKQSEQQTRTVSNRISERDVNTHKRRDIGKQNSLRSNTTISGPCQQKSNSGPHQLPVQTPEAHTSETLEHDVERFGNDIDGFEKSEGREGSLAGRLAREISHLAKDLHHKPPKKYSWEEWLVWLKMLGERDDESSTSPTPQRTTLRKTSGGAPVQILTVPGRGSFVDLPESASTTIPEATATPTIERHSPAPHNNGNVEDSSLDRLRTSSQYPSAYNERSHTQSEGDLHSAVDSNEVDWRWTWLGDQGPLFSRLTETEWILEKLCFRLEEVLEDEIRGARALANKRNRTPSTQ